MYPGLYKIPQRFSTTSLINSTISITTNKDVVAVINDLLFDVFLLNVQSVLVLLYLQLIIKTSQSRLSY